MNVMALPGVSVPFGAEIPIWDIQRSASWYAVSSSMVERGRGTYHSFIHYLAKLHSKSLFWS